MNNETGDVDTPLGRFDDASLKHFSIFGFNASVLPPYLDKPLSKENCDRYNLIKLVDLNIKGGSRHKN